MTPHPLPMDFVRQANRAEGGHFFDDETMRFFDSRIESRHALMNPSTEEAYFVTSERFADGLRRYKVRYIDGAARIHTASPRPLPTLGEAEALADALARAH